MTVLLFSLSGWITTFSQEEPKKVRFDYDLFLHLEGHPPVNHLRCEKLTFNNPTEEFRRKLLKAGGVGWKPRERLGLEWHFLMQYSNLYCSCLAGKTFIFIFPGKVHGVQCCFSRNTLVHSHTVLHINIVLHSQAAFFNHRELASRSAVLNWSLRSSAVLRIS